MGDEFTKEELKALGEEVESEETEETETEEVTEEPEEAKEPKDGDEEEPEATGEAETKEKTDEATTKTENLIPQHRVDQLTARAKTAEEKLNLLRSNPESYYKQYPDERPAKQAAPVTSLAGKDEISTIRSMVIEGGNYDRQLFGEVFKKDPRAAYAIDPYYARKLDDYQRDLTVREESDRKTIQSRALSEANVFAEARAKEISGGKDKESLTDAEKAEINSKVLEIGHKVIAWQKANGKLNYSLSDAYVLMNHGKDIAKAKADGAKTIVDNLGNSVASVSTSRGAGKVTGYEADISMTAGQLSEKLDKMDDGAYQKWIKNAPAELKKKHPNIPW